MVKAELLGVTTVAPPQGGSHLVIISDPTHQSTSDGSVHIRMTQGKDVNWIKSRTQFDRWEETQLDSCMFDTVIFFTSLFNSLLLVVVVVSYMNRAF